MAHRPARAVVFVALLLSPFVVHGRQQAPNLTGVWTAATDAPGALKPAPSPTLGPRFEIRQTGSKLVLVRPAREGTLTVEYATDGSRSSYRIPGRMCDGDSEVFETVAWEGGALAFSVVGRRAAGATTDTPLAIKRLLRPDGDRLIVEASTTQAGKPVPVATVYRRGGEPLPTTSIPSVVQPTRAPATIEAAAWIAGVWSGPNGSLTVEERWTPPASGGMIGVGRTLRGTALANFEFLCIAEREGTLVYAAMPDGRSPATYFTLTGSTADSLTFENPTHDFPKLIRYSKRADGALITTISGGPGTKETNFVLLR